jgi:hypothetical protein
MNWSDVGKFAANLSPIVGGLLGGPAGAAMGSIIAKEFGCDNTPDAIHAAITNNPDAALKLAQLESDERTKKLQFEYEGKKLIAESERANLATITGAQDMQKEALKQEDNFSKRFIYWLAIGWSVFSFGYIIAITFFNIPQPNLRFADTILGFLLGTAMSGILQFFFGSSVGSRRAQEALINSK